MSKTYTDAEIGAAVRVLASLFTLGGTAALAAVAPKEPKSGTASTASDAGQAPKGSSPAPSQAGESSPSTPAPPKDEAVGGNSQNLTAEAFSKLGMQFAKDLGDQGAKAKEIWAKYQKADGTPVGRFGEVQPKDYDAMIAEWEEAKLA